MQVRGRAELTLQRGYFLSIILLVIRKRKDLLGIFGLVSIMFSIILALTAVFVVFQLANLSDASYRDDGGWEMEYCSVICWEQEISV